jgi:hypothetical protein
MNITLFKKYDNIFASDILHSYWVTPIEDASGLFSNWKDFSDYSEEELENLKFDVNPTTISIPNNEIINAYGMFTNNKLIRKVEIDFPNATNIGTMFASSSIEEIECDFSSVNENNGGAFAKCNKLKTVRCDFRNLEKRVMGAGPGYSPPDIDGLDRYGYGFSFNGSPNLTTCECNFASLKNADNLFNKCSKLTTFNCELDSLESAVGLCPNAVLTLESVDNIAKKIKNHKNSDTSHNIDIGIALNTSSHYPYKWAEAVNKIANKGWNVTVKLNGGSGEILNASDYPDLTVTSYSISEKINTTENNKIEHTSSEGKDEVKTGFVMVSPDIDKKFNRIKLKTGAAHGGTKNVYIRVKDSNKQVITSSNITTVTTPSTEYEFIFDKAFTMIKNEKYYFEIFLEEESNRLNFSFRLAKPTEGSLAYGTLYEDSPTSYKIRYSSDDDDYPSGDDGNDGEYNAWCKFYLEDEEKTIITEQVDLDVFNSTVFEINGRTLTNWSEESALILNLSPSNDNVSITNSYIFYLVDETGAIIDTEEELPVTLYFSNNNDTTTGVKIEKKKDTNGNYIETEPKNYSALIGISGNDNKVYYKNFNLIVN